MSDVVRQAPRSVAFDGGLLLRADDERLFLLDNLAAQIWRAHEVGLSAADIARALGEANPAQSAAVIQRDVSALLTHWSEEGLLGQPNSDIADPPAPVAFNRDVTWAGEWKCGFHNLTVDIAVESPTQVRLLDRLFSHFPSESAETNASIEVRESRDGEAVVFVDGREFARTCTARNVQRALLGLVWPNNPLCALIHGGCVALGDKAACFVGISGSGKTTFIARLVSQGLTYLSDDLIGIDTSGRALPWPMPMSVKLGSWDTLSNSYPSLETAPTFKVKGTQARSVKPATDAWELGPTKTHLLVFPRYSSGGATQLVRLSQFETLRRLIEAGFLIESPVDAERVEIVVQWLERLPAYSLNYGDVDDAAARVTSLLTHG